MNDAAKKKWDRIYTSNTTLQPRAAAAVLTEHCFLLSVSGSALDLACGLGGNACFLANKGFKVDAWDISRAALLQLDTQAARDGLAVHTRVINIKPGCFPNKAYDVIIVSRFLDRSVCHGIMDALNPGGLLFYQTYTREKLSPLGPNNPEYLLVGNELLSLFAPLQVVFYEDNARLGDVRYGLRNEALFIGRKLP